MLWNQPGADRAHTANPAGLSPHDLSPSLTKGKTPQPAHLADSPFFEFLDNQIVGAAKIYPQDLAKPLPAPHRQMCGQTLKKSESTKSHKSPW
jgi:hypothetical protein